MEPSEDAYDVGLKAGNMCLNRFSIDEDAAFELSGIHYLEKTSSEIIYKENQFEFERNPFGFEFENQFEFEEGRGYLSLIAFIRVNHFEFP